MPRKKASRKKGPTRKPKKKARKAPKKKARGRPKKKPKKRPTPRGRLGIDKVTLGGPLYPVTIDIKRKKRR